MIPQKNIEITELLFNSVSINENIRSLKTADKCMVIAVLINRESNGRSSRYFLIREGRRFCSKIPRKKLRKLMDYYDQFDCITLLYTRPAIHLKRMKVLNKILKLLPSLVAILNSQIKFDILSRSVDKYLNQELDMETYLHILINESFIVTNEFKENKIAKNFFNGVEDTVWNSYLKSCDVK